MLHVSYRQKNSRIKRVWIALASHIGFSTVHLTFPFEKQVGMEFPTLNAARIVAEKQVCRNIFARSLFCSDGLFRLQSAHFILVKPYANACYLCF
jgi:hypothetical protein